MVHIPDQHILLKVYNLLSFKGLRTIFFWKNISKFHTCKSFSTRFTLSTFSMDYLVILHFQVGQFNTSSWEMLHSADKWVELILIWNNNAVCSWAILLVQKNFSGFCYPSNRSFTNSSTKRHTNRFWSCKLFFCFDRWFVNEPSNILKLGGITQVCVCLIKRKR